MSSMSSSGCDRPPTPAGGSREEGNSGGGIDAESAWDSIAPGRGPRADRTDRGWPAKQMLDLVLDLC